MSFSHTPVAPSTHPASHPPQVGSPPRGWEDPLLSAGMKRALQQLGIEASQGVLGVVNAYMRAGCPMPTRGISGYRAITNQPRTIKDVWTEPGVHLSMMDPSPEAAWKRMDTPGGSGSFLDPFLAMQSTDPKIRLGASSRQPGLTLMDQVPSIDAEHMSAQQAAGTDPMRATRELRTEMHTPSFWAERDPETAQALEEMHEETRRKENMPYGRATRKYPWGKKGL